MANEPNLLQRLSSQIFSSIFRNSHRRHLQGLPVAVSPQDPATLEPIFDKLCEALGLLHRYDARAIRELLTYTEGIFVFGTTGGTPAEWLRDERLVALQYEYAADAAHSAQALALVLVHEATHVWLERLGFEYTAERRTRLEAICHRRELRLARRLPDGQDLVNWLTQAPKPEDQHFTDEAFRERARAELQRLGVPAWLVRQVAFWSKCMNRLTSAWRRPA